MCVASSGKVKKSFRAAEGDGKQRRGRHISLDLEGNMLAASVRVVAD